MPSVAIKKIGSLVRSSKIGLPVSSCSPPAKYEGTRHQPYIYADNEASTKSKEKCTSVLHYREKALQTGQIALTLFIHQLNSCDGSKHT